ncbi:MAG: type II toxin-antitoxin system VapC family toxin [Saprospiraceae bacterium]|nr:type II toxin-antitoxin system VapC family toxin [Saprospiraceae bacterium]
MRLLLDTHTFIWFIEGDPQISPAAIAAISDPNNESWISAGSLWEMAIKINIGKLNTQRPFHQTLGFIASNGIRWLPIEFSHMVEAAALPLLHRDPFDRMLIAQALTEGLTIVTKDTWIPQYGVNVFW